MFERLSFSKNYTSGKKDAPSCSCMIWNRGILYKHNTCLKSHHSLGRLAPNKYESHLSNKLLYILVDQEAAKMFKVEVGGQPENCRLSPTRTLCARGWLNCQIFYQPPTLTFYIFVAPWPRRMYSTLFKRSDSYLFGARSPRLWYDF